MYALEVVRSFLQEKSSRISPNMTLCAKPVGAPNTSRGSGPKEGFVCTLPMPRCDIISGILDKTLP